MQARKQHVRPHSSGLRSSCKSGGGLLLRCCALLTLLACCTAQGGPGGPPLVQGAQGGAASPALEPAPEPAGEPLTIALNTPPAPVVPAPPATQVDPSQPFSNNTITTGPEATAPTPQPAPATAANPQQSALAPQTAPAAEPAPDAASAPSPETAASAPAPEVTAAPTAAATPAPTSKSPPPAKSSGASGSGGSNSSAAAVPSFDTDGKEYFITIGTDGNFHNGCKTFFPTGWNQFEVVEAGAGVPKLFAASIPSNKTGPQLIRDLMDDAVSVGLNMIRFFALPVDTQYTLQPQPGQFNEAVFRGLDYALEQARVRGIKVIMPLINNWNDTGGVGDVVNWNGLPTHEAFFSDPGAMQTYKNTVAAILGRVNTINGRTYSNDPTIMAWNLINEPRAYQSTPQMQSWIATMAAYVKSLDTTHLVGIGEEGFYETGSPDFDANPQGAQSWAGTEGQDFNTNTATPGIDFATMHLWVDNWLDNTTQFPTTWINAHINGATTLGKPLLLEEFGKYADGRQAFFINIYNQVAGSASGGGPLKGSAFWQWYDNGQMVPGGGLGQYGMLLDDPTFTSIKQHAQDMLGLSKAVPGCTAQPYTGPSGNPCTSTWVNGQPGTGYEGPACDIDINECVRGTAGCAQNAGCTNSNGSYSCDCWYGYSGDGTTSCSPNAQLQGLQSLYVAAGPGMLACNQGTDVTVPVGAPGFAYDPTGAFASQNGYGTLLPVDVEGCQIACSMAGAACDSISYNPTLQACYLKSGTSTDDCQATTVACTTNTTANQAGACGDWTTYRNTGAAATAAAGAAAPSPAAEATPSLPGPPDQATGAATPLTADAAAPDVRAADGPSNNSPLAGRRLLLATT